MHLFVLFGFFFVYFYYFFNLYFNQLSYNNVFLIDSLKMFLVTLNAIYSVTLLIIF